MCYPPPPPSELSRYAYFNLNNISTVFYNIIGLRPINPFDWFLRVLILLNIASIISFRLKITPAYLCVIVGVLYTLHTRSVNSVSWISFIAGYLYSANKPKLYMYVLTCIALISYFIFVRYTYINTPLLFLNFIVLILGVNLICFRVGLIPLKKFFTFMGSMSLELYLMHTVAVMVSVNISDSIIARSVFFIGITIVLTAIFRKLIWIFNMRFLLQSVNGKS